MSAATWSGRAPTGVEHALAALRAGRPVLVLDDEARENEGDAVLAAQTLSTEWVAWMIRHTSGYLCAPLPEADADRLALPLMVTDNRDPLRTAYTITVDARDGITTGISAADRAQTLRLLADPDTEPHDLVRPGHVVPLRAREGGVLTRAGHTEATVDLCRLAGLAPVGAIAELVNDDGTMMRTAEVARLAAEYDLPVITVAELAQWRLHHDRVQEVTRTILPTGHGTFEAVGYRDRVTGAEHLALISPEGLSGVEGSHPAVRVHSECLTGDVFGSRRCDCGPQLQHSLAQVAEAGGVVVYLRGHEGRGVGLLSKLEAYRLQDAGADTIEAQTRLGLPVDAREYGAAAAILRALGITSLTLMTNNPLKVTAMREGGLDVVHAAPIRIPHHAESERYLRTKRDRMGHDILITATAEAVASEGSPA